MGNERKPKIDILEAIQARFRSYEEGKGSDKFRRINPAPQGGPDYKLEALRREDERLRQSFEQAVEMTLPEIGQISNRNNR